MLTIVTLNAQTTHLPFGGWVEVLITTYTILDEGKEDITHFLLHQTICKDLEKTGAMMTIENVDDAYLPHRGETRGCWRHF